MLVRIRPLIRLETEERQTSSVVSPDQNEVVIAGNEPRTQLRCGFDTVFGPSASQSQVYEHVADCAARVAQGYNATIIAYGQTGSGKTHTMFGPPGWALGDDAGMIPRAVDVLFQLVKGKTVYASFMQVYREQIYDMLRDPGRSRPLEISGTFVNGLSEYAVRSANDCFALIRAGEENRAVRETQMNELSSRSHSIFTLVLEQKTVNDDGECTLRSKFNMVDLAGSEKWDLRQDMRADRVAEMTRINLSLHTLGKCVAALASDKDVHVPYRESKLTRLLADSLGGNSVTRLVATLSPAADCVEESISTLRFADRARNVIATVRRNAQRPIDHALVARLRSEVTRLRAIIEAITTPSGQDTSDKPPELDVAKLLAELEHLRIENDELRKTTNKPPPAVGNNNNNKRKALVLPSIVPTTSTDERPPPSSDHPDFFEPLSLVAQYRLTKRNERLEAVVSSVRRIAGDFFTFKIEEDAMRTQLDAAFKSLDTHEVLPTWLTRSEKSPPPREAVATKVDDEAEPEKKKEVLPAPPKKVKPPEPEMMLAMEAAAAAGPKYRIRQGATRRGSSGWIDPEVEREEALKRELRDTKARMRKHAKMREWLIRKSEQEAQAAEREEADQEEARAVAVEKEAKFRRRAEKQKRKLALYYESLRTEAAEASPHHSPARESPTRDPANDDEAKDPADELVIVPSIVQTSSSPPKRDIRFF